MNVPSALPHPPHPFRCITASALLLVHSTQHRFPRYFSQNHFHRHRNMNSIPIDFIEQVINICPGYVVNDSPFYNEWKEGMAQLSARWSQVYSSVRNSKMTINQRSHSITYRRGSITWEPMDIANWNRFQHTIELVDLRLIVIDDEDKNEYEKSRKEPRLTPETLKRLNKILRQNCRLRDVSVCPGTKEIDIPRSLELFEGVYGLQLLQIADGVRYLPLLRRFLKYPVHDLLLDANLTLEVAELIIDSMRSGMLRGFDILGIYPQNILDTLLTGIVEHFGEVAPSYLVYGFADHFSSVAKRWRFRCFPPTWQKSWKSRKALVGLDKDTFKCYH